MNENNENVNPAEQPARPVSPVATKPKKPWYKNGWVWTGVGVAAVTGVTIALCCKGKSKDVVVAAAPAAGEVIEQGLMAIL